MWGRFCKEEAHARPDGTDPAAPIKKSMIILGQKMKTQIHINNSDMGDAKAGQRQARFLLNRGAFGVDDKTLWGYGQNIVAPRSYRRGPEGGLGYVPGREAAGADF